MRFARTLVSISLIAVCALPDPSMNGESLTREAVQAAERQRLQALVDGNLPVAARRIASDFRSLTP